jgi:hypothetical protein
VSYMLGCFHIRRAMYWQLMGVWAQTIIQIFGGLTRHGCSRILANEKGFRHEAPLCHNRADDLLRQGERDGECKSIRSSKGSQLWDSTSYTEPTVTISVRCGILLTLFSFGPPSVIGSSEMRPIVFAACHSALPIRIERPMSLSHLQNATYHPP